MTRLTFFNELAAAADNIAEANRANLRPSSGGLLFVGETLRAGPSMRMWAR